MRCWSVRLKPTPRAALGGRLIIALAAGNPLGKKIFISVGRAGPHQQIVTRESTR